jgi:hypothetical protein
MNDNELMTTVRERFDPMRMHIPAETIVARGRSLRRRRGAAVGGALAVALGAGLAVPALTAGTASPEHATLAAWTVDNHHDDSIAVTIRELRDLPALQRALHAAGARVTITEKKAFPDWSPNACSVREWSAFSGVKFEGAGKYFFILHPAKILPGTVLEITVVQIKQPPGAPSLIPLTPSGDPVIVPSPAAAPVAKTYAFAGETPSIAFMPVRDVPSCLS